MRVLHCPNDTGGQAWGLSRAERELGVQSEVMVRRTSWHGIPCDVDLRLRDGSYAARAARLFGFLARAIRRYDVFHFNWGMSILDYWFWNLNYVEVPLLKRLGKRIVVTFQGCDARLKTVSREMFATSACAQCDVAWCTPRLDEIRRRRIRKVFSFADKVFVLNPDLMHGLPGGEFLPYASVDPRQWTPAVEPLRPSARAPFLVLHMPTNASIKGTGFLVQACDTLRGRGVPVELLLVRETPHEKIPDLIRRADVVVDQLLIGWYGATAVEAMALQKPVLCYLREEDLKRFVPFHDEIPIVRTTKETLADDLARLWRNAEERRALGLAGRRFVETRHDPLTIARQTIAAYQGTSG